MTRLDKILALDAALMAIGTSCDELGYRANNLIVDLKSELEKFYDRRQDIPKINNGLLKIQKEAVIRLSQEITVFGV